MALIQPHTPLVRLGCRSGRANLFLRNEDPTGHETHQQSCGKRSAKTRSALQDLRPQRDKGKSRPMCQSHPDLQQNPINNIKELFLQGLNGSLLLRPSPRHSHSCHCFQNSDRSLPQRCWWRKRFPGGLAFFCKNSFLSGEFPQTGLSLRLAPTVPAFVCR